MNNVILKSMRGEDIAERMAIDEEQLALTNRRLAALLRRQEREPTWTAFDLFIGENVSIDIRIEEQRAVRDELIEEIAMLSGEKLRRQGFNQTIPMFGRGA